MSGAGIRKWFGIAVLILTATLLVALRARTQRTDCAGQYVSLEEAGAIALQNHGKPCDCSDIPALQAKLDDVAQRLQQFVNYGQRGADSGPAPGDTEPTDIIGRIQNRGPNHDICTPVVCDSLVSKCTALWMATLVHEGAHCQFFEEMGRLRQIGIRLRMVWYNAKNGNPQQAEQAFKAESEIAAYTAELAYLAGQLDALKKRCPKRGLYPSLDDNAGNQIKTASSADRVGGYASAM